MLRSDSNQPFLKENFLAGIPKLLGEKVRAKLREKFEGSIPYERLTYGDLVSQIHKESLQICTNFKLQKEEDLTEKELGTFCE